MVLAFDIIRRRVSAAGTPTGPIVILSYKNHSLDEFLCDVVRSSSVMRPGYLLRCGNTDVLTLGSYLERNSEDERRCQKALASCIDLQRKSRKIAFDWKERARDLHDTTIGDLERSKVAMALWRAVQHGFRSSIDSEDKSILEYLINGSKVNDDSIPELFYECEHWSTSSMKLVISPAISASLGAHEENFALPLVAWLLGFILPPRCQKGKDDRNGKRCARVTAKGVDYCKDHCCRSSNCNNECVDYKFYCQAHCCSVQKDCIVQGIGEFQICPLHLCANCAIVGRISRKVIQDSCINHCCKYQDCNALTLLPYQFCSEHCCKICIGLSLPVVKPVDGQYCHQHTCTVSTCNRARINNNSSTTCEVHTCCVCLQCVDLTTPTTIAARLCKAHRCTYADEECNNTVAIYRSLESGVEIWSAYCSEHTCTHCSLIGNEDLLPVEEGRDTCAEHILCEFNTNNGKRCKNLCVEGLLHCQFHNEVANQQLQNSLLHEDGQCCGKAASGKRCQQKKKNKSLEVFWFCNDHLDQDSSNTQLQAFNREEVYERKFIQEPVPILTDLIVTFPVKDYECLVKRCSKKCELTQGICGTCTIDFAAVDQVSWVCPTHVPRRNLYQHFGIEFLLQQNLEEEVAVRQSTMQPELIESSNGK